MEHGAPHASITDLLWPVINFGLFVFVVVRFLGGPLREFFRARTERIRQGLEAGAQARSEAQGLRDAIARELADLPRLREELRADIRATAERERDALLASGRVAAERIRTDARMVADQEVTAARQNLRAELIEEAVREATILVRGALRPDDQGRFVRDFVASAGGAG